MYKHPKYDKIHLMRQEANNHGAYEDIIRTIGPLDKTITDNPQVLAACKFSYLMR